MMHLLEDPREVAVRQKWRDLVDRRMPQLAKSRDWPVTEGHCFARILLDVASQEPWREVMRPPAWANAPLEVLEDAISLGEAVIEGSADLVALNRLSLRMRGKLRQSA